VELEKSEQEGSVTLNTLQRAAEALGCRLVYVLVPERPLADVVAERAKLVAERQSKAIEHTMRLEDQAVKDKRAARALREQAIEDLLKRPARLWDEE
jgi:predicted DNA-binding mobile mystery protein A